MTKEHKLEEALGNIVGLDSQINAAANGDREVVYGPFARIARAALSDHKAEARVKQLEAEKSILMGAIAFAINVEDHYDRLTFLQSFTDGSADEDEEWKDWREFRAGLVLHGTVAKQSFPELPVSATDEDESELLTIAYMNGAEDTKRDLLSDEALERSAKAIHDGPLSAGDEEDFGTSKASDWCREVARTSIHAALKRKEVG